MSSRDMIGAVDWHLLLLFVCLFGVTAAFAKTGVAQDGLRWLAAHGLLPDRLGVMAPLTLVASNTIGNVPAVILILRLLPDLSDGALDRPGAALHLRRQPAAHRLALQHHRRGARATLPA